MAFTTTTLNGAITRDDQAAVLTSISGLVVGDWARIDQEIVRIVSIGASASVPVGLRRGLAGTAAAAHVSGANFVAGKGARADGTTDWGQAGEGAASVAGLPTVRTRQIASYGAAGAIAVPDPGIDGVAIINGTGALAMTLAQPSKAKDGDFMLVVANGKAAHTVTVTGGLGDGGTSFDVGTFSASLQMSALLVACNGFWVSIGPTSATAMAGSPTWA